MICSHREFLNGMTIKAGHPIKGPFLLVRLNGLTTNYFETKQAMSTLVEWGAVLDDFQSDQSSSMKPHF